MLRRSILALTCAAVALASPALAARPKQAAVGEFTTQLPRNASPVHYAIRFKPDATKLSFTSQVAITVDLKSASDSITLNAAEIDFAKASIRPEKGAAIAATVSTDAKAQTATLKFAQKLPAGRYILDIDYSGKIYQQANGLFALDYKDPKGAQKRALFTQFEAPDARRFVPSWDEPFYKTTFDMMATVPSDQMAVSNMPISARRDVGGGMSDVSFSRSPKMSTYLLFFGLGEFDRITTKVGPTEIGVIVGQGNGPKGQYALDASAKIVAYYNDYFGTPYPLPKLDNVAGPGQSQFFSAMENWGAIFTFERVLLDDPKITSARGRQAIFATDAHEIAHQWFGNLVTMGWWDDLWLNEGFASWMESKTTARFNPDWQAELDRVGGRESAMSLDAYVTTHPVVQKITTVEQTSQAFDSITYQKGEAVITMLEAYAGEDVWRTGIRAYMKKHAYANTRSDDLWNAVEAAGAKGLTKIAGEFINQPGVPMIRVDSAVCRNGSTQLSLSQGEFSRDAKARADAKPLRWSVPVIAEVVGGKAVTGVTAAGKASMTLPGCGTVVVNAGQTGYYRTLYKPEMVATLTKDFTKLQPIDQLGLLNDSERLSNSEYQPMSAFLTLVDAVDTNAGARIVEDTADSLYGMYERFREEPARQKQIADRTTAKFAPRLRSLKLKQEQSDSALDANLRSSLIGTLGGMGNAEVLAEARRLFAELDTNPAALDGPLRTTWLGVIAYNADQPTWDKIRKLGQSAESQLVKSTMYRLLGASKDEALAKQALALALTPEPGATLSAAIIAAVARNHPDLATDFALANQKAVEGLVDVASRSEFIPGLGAGSNDPAMVGKLEAYAKVNLTAESRKPVDQAITSITTRLKTEPRIKAGIVEWLDAKPAAAQASAL